jgi:hypothetical protein
MSPESMNRYRNLRAISRPTAVFPDATGPSMAITPGMDTVRIFLGEYAARQASTNKFSLSETTTGAVRFDPFA